MNTPSDESIRMAPLCARGYRLLPFDADLKMTGRQTKATAIASGPDSGAESRSESELKATFGTGQVILGAMLVMDTRALPRLGYEILGVALEACLLLSTGCNGVPAGTAGSDASPVGDASTAPGPCDPDPLRTNLTTVQNGLSVDIDDCPILEFTAKYHEPDAMIFKAIIYVESRFQYDAIGCTGNTGCCPQSGWTGNECACLGAMQTGPACGGSSTLGLLPDGHPDLDTDPGSPDWANSCFNPAVNIELGIAGIAGNRMQVEQQFPGCTEDQYTLMAIGNFNSYGSTKSCTDYNMTYDSAVLDAYNQYAAASGWPAHAY
jgi:hypothetical protein